MEPSLFSPELLSWLEQRGGAYLVAAVWIWTLLRERSTSRRTSEKLSEALCRAIESGSAERAKIQDESLLRHDWTVRSILEAFTALVARREISVPDMRPPKPPKPPKPPESDPPQPPPLPQPPTPPVQRGRLPR